MGGFMLMTLNEEEKQLLKSQGTELLNTVKSKRKVLVDDMMMRANKKRANKMDVVYDLEEYAKIQTLDQAFLSYQSILKYFLEDRPEVLVQPMTGVDGIYVYDYCTNDYDSLKMVCKMFMALYSSQQLNNKPQSLSESDIESLQAAFSSYLDEFKQRSLIQQSKAQAERIKNINEVIMQNFAVLLGLKPAMKKSLNRHE